MDQELLDFEAPHNGTPTSQMAAEEIKPHLGRLQSEVYSFLLKKGSAGATCDEVEVALGLPYGYMRTCRPRLGGATSLSLSGIVS
jgi:hypothetical protein